MRAAVITDLPEPSGPYEWGNIVGGVLFTSQYPLRPDGSLEDGPVAVQMELTLTNLTRTLEAAGGSLDDVVQVLLYIVDANDFPDINRVYQRFFTRPYPNRATVVVAALLSPGIRLELVAQAHIGSGDKR